MKRISRRSVAELHWLADEFQGPEVPRRQPLLEHESQRLLKEFEIQKIELKLQNQELLENLQKLEKAMVAHEKLEQKVAERTHSLEIALREQESFSYSVSHDLRAPLRHINSYLTILAEDFGPLLPSEAHRLIDRSCTASQKMGKLIDDLLELARISRIKLVKDAVNLSDLASNICEALHETEPHRPAEFAISDGLFARGDKLLLTQMMMNLLGNAWKYTSTKPSAYIEFGKLVESGQEMFYVKDNGVGFDMEYSEKLFGEFQRLHGAEFEGNGIGLATVKRILERHRGRVWADSKVGEGAVFYFTL
jgi:light-regulated signal transduction histidine kinase (bacteriophytochrome)